MYVDTPDQVKQRITSMVLMIRDVVLYSNSIGKKTYDHFVCDPDEIGLVPRAVELLQVVFPDSIITSCTHIEGRLIKITVDWSEGGKEKERKPTLRSRLHPQSLPVCLRPGSPTLGLRLPSDEVEYSASMCEPTDT